MNEILYMKKKLYFDLKIFEFLFFMDPQTSKFETFMSITTY